MKFIKTKIEDLYIIQLEPIEDERGQFYRVFCKNELNQIHLNKNIMQINQSLTKKKGVIRGMHFQYPPKAETKLVKCINGKVYDVAVDLRRNSSTFLCWHGEILSAQNMKVIYIPEGFAHGFQTLKNNCELLYLHTEFYDPKYESGIRFDDPKVNIKWPLKVTQISKRDKNFNLIDENFLGLKV